LNKLKGIKNYLKDEGIYYIEIPEESIDYNKIKLIKIYIINHL
jgi:hypothetical protein